MPMKPWTFEEDNILRCLHEAQIKKGSCITQRMASEFQITGRTGKQCKKRYQQLYGQPNAENSWTISEQRKLNTLHDIIGNKWAVIAQKMEGRYSLIQHRTDNSIKNYFYSTLRKALRKLNNVIRTQFKSRIKQLRPLVLYKIIEATDEHLKSPPSISQELIQLSKSIKTDLFEYHNNDDSDLSKLRQLCLNIEYFNKNYKRRPKKIRRGEVQCNNLLKVIPKIEKFKCVSDEELDDYQSSQNANKLDQIELSEHKSIEYVEVRQKMQKRDDMIKNSEFLAQQFPLVQSVVNRLEQQMNGGNNLLNSPLNGKSSSNIGQHSFHIKSLLNDNIELYPRNQASSSKPTLPQSSFKLLRDDIENYHNYNSLKSIEIPNDLQEQLRNANILEEDSSRQGMEYCLTSQYYGLDRSHNFNLGESTEKLRLSVLLKNDIEGDEDRLFKSKEVPEGL